MSGQNTGGRFGLRLRWDRTIPHQTGSPECDMPVGAAYPSRDLQADPVTASPRVTCAGRYSLESETFRPYKFGHSDPRLRPTIPAGC